MLRTGYRPRPQGADIPLRGALPDGCERSEPNFPPLTSYLLTLTCETRAATNLCVAKKKGLPRAHEKAKLADRFPLGGFRRPGNHRSKGL